MARRREQRPFPLPTPLHNHYLFICVEFVDDLVDGVVGDSETLVELGDLLDLK